MGTEDDHFVGKIGIATIESGEDVSISRPKTLVEFAVGTGFFQSQFFETLGQVFGCGFATGRSFPFCRFFSLGTVIRICRSSC